MSTIYIVNGVPTKFEPDSGSSDYVGVVNGVPVVLVPGGSSSQSVVPIIMQQLNQFNGGSINAPC